MSDVVFDLTEVFSASTGKLRFYGIMRVVQEIGIELVRQKAPMRFAVFSYAHQGFFEVYPILREDGAVDLDVPLGIRELRIRSAYKRKSAFSKLGRSLINPVLKAMNTQAWRRTDTRPKMLDMSGKTLVSAARPKLIVDAIETLDKRKQRFNLVALLHDMIPLHKEFGHKSAYFPGKFLDDNSIILDHARLLLANSEFTKSEIQRFSQKGLLPPAPPITTIPLVHECAPGTDAPTIVLPRSPYILTVGATLGRKNLQASLEALLMLQQLGKPVPTLVIAGATRKTTENVLNTDRMAPIRDKVVTYPSPAQEDLVALYKGALALVMASRMEGWGLPAGEALWLGTPAICSTAPVFKEVCGDLGLYFDPDRPKELVAHLTRLSEDTAYADELRDQIVSARPQLRTWAHVAKDLQSAVL